MQQSSLQLSKEMVLFWIKRARELGATHIVLMYDTEDKEEYPVFIEKSEDLEEKLKKLRLSEGKQEIREVIDI